VLARRAKCITVEITGGMAEEALKVLRASHADYRQWFLSSNPSGPNNSGEDKVANRRNEMTMNNPVRRKRCRADFPGLAVG
jgi:hypothetical protein